MKRILIIPAVFFFCVIQMQAATPAKRGDILNYADPESCVECHKTACDDWKESDHSRSMDHASSSIVLGDFNDIRFIHIGFDDLLDFDETSLKILLDEIYDSPQPSWLMRDYGAVAPGRKFNTPQEARFEDFALACFDAKPGVKEKLLSVMSESHRKEFDAETEYRKTLIVNRPTDIAGAQSRIVERLRHILNERKIDLHKIPKKCTIFRMYKNDEIFMVDTDTGSYEVLFVLGNRPLQQYMVETEGGRLQCLPIAWDCINHKWYHLYPKEQIQEDDPLHWSKPLQNWNFMCADCHTTDFDKNFDTKTLSYNSNFVEINVGCQSCHGPCGKHVETATKNSFTNQWSEILPLETERLAGINGTQTVDSCAACHTRRRILRSGVKPPLEPSLDFFVPEMQDRSIYYPDGQLLEEAFEVGSFMQSKMYSKGVGCTNCHEPHSLNLKYEGNRLCTQCHTPSIYDTKNHHYHPDATKPGTQCVECHFPQSFYMVTDPRRDHSIRKPSPELTMKAGVPNSCTLCHQDRKKNETLAWAHEHVENWYAEKRKSQVGYSQANPISKHYALALQSGRRDDTGAAPLLAEIVRNKTDRDYRDIIRASALTLYGRTTSPDSLPLLIESLEDRSPLVRLAAIEGFANQPSEIKLKHLTGKLDDSLLALRLESARILAETSQQFRDEKTKKAFAIASREFVDSCTNMNDQAASYLNLAVFEHDIQSYKRREVETWFAATVRDLQQRNSSTKDASKVRNEYMQKLTEKPLDLYRQSLRIDPDFVPSRINLAMLHNERGEAKEAETQFKEVLRIDPKHGDAAYSLGLLLAETNRLSEADEYLKKAIELRPENARIRYNYALLLMQQEKRPEARRELESALKTEPNNVSFLYALAVLHLQDRNRNEAIKSVDRLIRIDPVNPQWRSLRNRVESLPK